MTPAEVALVAELAKAAAGLKIERDQVYAMESRLAPAARRAGFATISELLAAVRRGPDERLVWAVVESLLDLETGFFGDDGAFDRLAGELAAAPSAAPLRVLSAGCSGGQELWSVALAMEEAAGPALSERLQLTGVDLSARALEKARAGLYTQFEVQRGLPIRLLVRHFERSQEMWAVPGRIRRLAEFRRVNLHAGLGGLGEFDAVVCRQVLRGLHPDAHGRLIDSLAAAVRPGGLLILGAGEAAAGAAGALERVGEGLYRRRMQARAAA